MSGGFLRNGGGRRALELLMANTRGPHVQTHVKDSFSVTAVGRRTFKSSTPAILRHNYAYRNMSTKFKTAAAESPPSNWSLSYVATAGAATKTGFVNWYLRMLETKPVLTKGVTAGTIFTAADITSQMITSPDSLDLVRTLRMGGYGLFLSGPTLHLWFNFMSRVFPKQDLVNALKKVLCGQAIYGPVMTTVFFSVNAGLQGESIGEIAARLKRDLIPTLVNGLVYWPMCDFITYRFAPVRLQPLVSNIFSFLWTIYITYMASLKKAT